MSLHPPKPVKPAERPAFVWNGVTVSYLHSRRPRILRLEPSKARGGAALKERK